MVISARLIKRGRVDHRCAQCDRVIIGEKLRLFGAGMEGDPPYTIYMHPDCVFFKDRKVESILDGRTP